MKTLIIPREWPPHARQDIGSRETGKFSMKKISENKKILKCLFFRERFSMFAILKQKTCLTKTIMPIEKQLL